MRFNLVVDVRADNEREGENTADLHPNIEVIDEEGSTMSIPKTTFIWLLSESSGKLSTERLKRVQGSSNLGANAPKRIKFNYHNNEPSVFKSDELQIGCWALFKSNNNDIQNAAEQNVLDSYQIGFVTGFRVVDEKGKTKQLKLNVVPIGTDTSTRKNKKISKKMRLEFGDDTGFKDFQVLEIFYTYHQNQILHQIPEKFATKSQNYFATIKTSIPKRDGDSNSIEYYLPCEYNEFEKFIIEINSQASNSSKNI